MYVCLSIAKQYFVHTAEPLCVSVDDEDGDPTVCVRVFCYSATPPPSYPFQDKDIAIALLFSFVLYVVLFLLSTVHNHHHFIISRRTTTTRVTSSLFSLSLSLFSLLFLCVPLSLEIRIVSFDAV